MAAPAPLPIPAESSRLVSLPRYPLGLPQGSVRAILSLMIFGLIWALLLAPESKPEHIPLFLYYLMFLVLGHYFAARGHTPPPQGGMWHHQPLYLPRGSIRFLIVAGCVAGTLWAVYNVSDFDKRLVPNAGERPYLLPVIVGAFFVGIIVSRIGRHLLVKRGGLPYWFQDLMAWVALLAMFGMGILILIHLVINPTLKTPLEAPYWEGHIAALVAFYFGARS